MNDQQSAQQPEALTAQDTGDQQIKLLHVHSLPDQTVDAVPSSQCDLSCVPKQNININIRHY